MPTMKKSANVDLSGYTPISVPATFTPAQPFPPELRRSPVMIASLPGVMGGADAVIRQYNGGTVIPKGRFNNV